MLHELPNHSEHIPSHIHALIDSDPFLQSLPSIENITPVVGGVAHRVFEIQSPDEKYYLKVRGDHFVQIPEIACDPADIAVEHRALSRYNTIIPSYFPKVLSFSPDSYYMVLSDAFPGGDRFEDLLLNESATLQLIESFGHALAQIHQATSSVVDPIRFPNDRNYYHTVLGHRFGYRNNQHLDALVEVLSSRPQKQLILGDPSPKNLGVSNSGEQLIFFDLETAHIGDPVFDYAYALSHVLLHHIHKPETVPDVISSYQSGYGDHGFEYDVVKKITLGIILYRCKSIVPYPLLVTDVQRLRLEECSEKLLAYDLTNVLWEDIIEELI